MRKRTILLGAAVISLMIANVCVVSRPPLLLTTTEQWLAHSGVHALPGIVTVLFIGAGLVFYFRSREKNMYRRLLLNEQERREAAVHLQEVEAQLRQAEKMETVGQLAGGIAHDFNNVLGGIIGFTELSLELVEKNSALEKNLLRILKAGDRAKHLVTQILTFSRQGNSQKSITAFPPIIEEVVELLRASIPSSVIVASDIAANAKPVLADPTNIHETLLNLATNAVHAMNYKGILTIRLYSVSLYCAQHGRSGEIAPGDYTVVEVADSGSGMDALTLSKAFDPFFTTKAVGKGTGMGLSVVLGVVQTHGGDLQVDSAPGKGTTMRLFFPAAADAPPEAVTIQPTIRLAGNERILFVDDEQTLVEMAEKLLVPLGYTVVGMTDSLAAMEFLKEQSSTIDILVTDQTMPGITGIELAREALERQSDLPIILCTGYSNEVTSESTAAIGIRQFVMKPYRIHEISTSIRDLLDAKKKDSYRGKNFGN